MIAIKHWDFLLFEEATSKRFPGSYRACYSENYHVVKISLFNFLIRKLLTFGTISNHIWKLFFACPINIASPVTYSRSFFSASRIRDVFKGLYTIS